MILQVDSVRKNYGERNILSDVHLALHPGQITALFGRNGEGKTTLFKLLMGLEKAAQIHIKYGEQTLQSFDQKINILNYLPQHHFLPSNRQIMPLAKAYLGPQAYDEIKKESLFTAFKHVKPQDLSGGERRLIELLFVLNSDQPILLLDEPFKNLDPKYQSLMKESIAKYLSKNPHKSILITDHNYNLVLDLAHRILLLKDGYLKELSSVQALIDLNYLPSSH